MASFVQVVGQIRFALDQLSSRNGHHEFEHLCRHYAKARVCSNILPATGPVSSGGDQGRDFETFRTYLTNTVCESSFVGLATDRVVVFACTLQRKEVASKIENDVLSIVKYGLPVDSIHIFSTTDVPVGKRHEIQKWADEEHSVDIFIHDGRALAEGLADREVFWIAVEFLEVPADIYPEPTQSNWYGELIQKWTNSEVSPKNVADFVEIADGLRQATFIPERRKDLHFWAAKMDFFLSSGHPRLRRRAVYEIAVSELRGKGSMIGQESRLREYFSSVDNLYSPSEFEDAVVLATYCYKASANEAVELTEVEIDGIRSNLATALSARIESADNVSTKCGLIELKGYLELNSSMLGVDGFSIEAAFEHWIYLLELVDDGPLFPLDRFADRVTAFNYLLGDYEQYDDLTSLIDEKLAERAGGFVAAEKARDRAIQFHKRTRIIKAIAELQKAKLNWFADETVPSCIVTMHYLSRWYSELGLCMAGKYLALSGCTLTAHSTNDDVVGLTSPLAVQVAICDFLNGSWQSFLESAEAALKLHFNLARDAGNLDKHVDVQELIFQLAATLAVTERIVPQNHGRIADVIGSFQIGDILDVTYAQVRKFWESEAEDVCWTSIHDQLWDIPFSDSGDTRTIRWRSLGLSWNASWWNEYVTNAMGEQFVATLQIVLADLACTDLCVIPSRVEISFSVVDRREPVVSAIASNDASSWKIEWPSNQDPDDLDGMVQHVLAATITILANLSLWPREAFMERIQGRFRDGLCAKAFFGRPHSELLMHYVSEASFLESARQTMSRPQPPDSYTTREHEELAWNSSPGPTYSSDEAARKISERYELMPLPIRHTLRSIRNDPSFQEVVSSLRTDGWPDWQIIAAVFQVAMNYRIPMRPTDALRDRQRQITWARQPESNDQEPIPASVFTEKALREQSIGFVMASILGWGLECRMRTPDLEAIWLFLDRRYGYWTDDVPHDDPFSATSNPENLIVIQ